MSPTSPDPESAAPPSPDEQPDGVSTRALRLLESLRPSERKVARALLADYPSAALGTASALAAAAGVSTPSVLRFAQALDFDGFTDLQEALRRELTEQAHAPMHRMGAPAGPQGPTMQVVVEQARRLAEEAITSLSTLPESELDAFVALLADTGRRVFLTGGRTSAVVAQSLCSNLEQVRTRVWALNDPYGRDLGQLLDVGRRDVHVFFDFARYQRSVINAAAEVHGRGATVVLITDEHLSPAAASADVVLPVSIRSPSPFDSLVAATMLTELVVPPVLELLGAKGRERYGVWESHHSRDVLP
ncbi:MAG TPA: MurR/RpiR family transcriptional regulator [Gryllotalpicola sp.]